MWSAGAGGILHLLQHHITIHVGLIRYSCVHKPNVFSETLEAVCGIRKLKLCIRQYGDKVIEELQITSCVCYNKREIVRDYDGNFISFTGNSCTFLIDDVKQDGMMLPYVHIVILVSFLGVIICNK